MDRTHRSRWPPISIAPSVLALAARATVAADACARPADATTIDTQGQLSTWPPSAVGGDRYTDGITAHLNQATGAT
jgi:hypothetical protein